MFSSIVIVSFKLEDVSTDPWITPVKVVTTGEVVAGLNNSHLSGSGGGVD